MTDSPPANFTSRINVVFHSCTFPATAESLSANFPPHTKIVYAGPPLPTVPPISIMGNVTDDTIQKGLQDMADAINRSYGLAITKDMLKGETYTKVDDPIEVCILVQAKTQETQEIIEGHIQKYKGRAYSGFEERLTRNEAEAARHREETR